MGICFSNFCVDTSPGLPRCAFFPAPVRRKGEVQLEPEGSRDGEVPLCDDITTPNFLIGKATVSSV